jgi:hypothetical protein
MRAVRAMPCVRAVCVRMSCVAILVACLSAACDADACACVRVLRAMRVRVRAELTYMLRRACGTELARDAVRADARCVRDAMRCVLVDA